MHAFLVTFVFELSEVGVLSVAQSSWKTMWY